MQLGYRATRALRWHPVMRAEVEELVDLRNRHVEAFVSLTSFLPLRAPLPPMGGYAMGADLAIELVTAVMAHRPKLAVELGSGVSTLVTAYALERAGGGRLVSIEHDGPWCEIARERLALHGFPNDLVEVEVRHAPLVSQQLDGRTVRWYEHTAIDDLRGIELLTIDGPPTETGPDARRPALPALASHLAPSAVIVVDDAGRIAERAAIDHWVEEFTPRLNFRVLDVAGGGAIGQWSAA